MGCQEPNDDKASKAPNEGLYNTENILVDINEKIYNNDESVKAYSIFSWTSETIAIFGGPVCPDIEATGKKDWTVPLEVNTVDSGA